jgi:hypothetical protein
MNFMDRLANGWKLLLNSFDVMMKNKKLLLFPVATACLTIVMAVLFLTPVALQPTSHSYTEKAHWAEVGDRLFVVGPPTAADLARGRKESVSITPVAYAFAAIFYFLSMFLATFFNVAFTHAIFNALEGKPVSVGEGISFACTKVKPILMWTLFAGLVGLIIKSLEEKFGTFGRFVVRSIGVAWSVASVFVIPVLVMEEHPDNPIGVVKQSAGVIRKAWGEALAGYAGLQFGGAVVGLASVVMIGAGLYLGIAEQQLAAMFAIIGVWFVGVCVFSYVMSVASQIYLCVLYRFATTGSVPQGYTPDMLTMAWRPKKA